MQLVTAAPASTVLTTLSLGKLLLCGGRYLPDQGDALLIKVLAQRFG